MFEIQNKAHAIFNTCYIISPNLGELHLRPWENENLVKSYGFSQIIDYRGQIISQYAAPGEAMVSAIIGLEGLRDFRVRSLWQNLVKSLRIEEYHIIYEAMKSIGGIYPKNLCLKDPPMKVADHDELLRYLINKMVDKGIYTPPKDWKPYIIKEEVIKRIEKVSKYKKN